MTILDEEEMTMENLTIEENSQILIEGTTKKYLLMILHFVYKYI